MRLPKRIVFSLPVCVHFSASAMLVFGMVYHGIIMASCSFWIASLLRLRSSQPAKIPTKIMSFCGKDVWEIVYHLERIDGATPISLGLSWPCILSHLLGVASHLLSLQCNLSGWFCNPKKTRWWFQRYLSLKPGKLSKKKCLQRSKMVFGDFFSEKETWNTEPGSSSEAPDVDCQLGRL